MLKSFTLISFSLFKQLTRANITINLKKNFSTNMHILNLYQIWTIAILRLNKAPVDDSLLNLLYVHGTPSFLQDNLHKEEAMTSKVAAGGSIESNGFVGNTWAASSQVRFGFSVISLGGSLQKGRTSLQINKINNERIKLNNLLRNQLMHDLPYLWQIKAFNIAVQSYMSIT